MALAPRRVASSVSGAVTETLEMGCLAAAAVGDWVYVSLATPNFVDVATDNQDKRAIIGKISAKPTTILATVVLSGVQPTALITSGRVYLGATGEETTANITGPAFQQNIGYSFGNGLLRVSPSSVVTKLL